MAKLLTQFSSHANTIADTFRAAFVKAPLGDCTFEMTAPDESTKGGLLGLQHVTLKTPSGLVIVIGSVHAGEQRAELRSYGLVAKAFEERCKKAPPFTEAEYATFLGRALPILAAFGLQGRITHVLDAGTPLSLPPLARLKPGVPKRSLLSWIGFGVGLIVILTGAMIWLRRLGR